jgi:hypothetical protein
MKKIILVYFLCFSGQLLVAQALDSTRLEFFFRSGRDQTKQAIINPTPNSNLNDAYKKGLRTSDFTHGNLGIVFQKPNGWGFGLVYSFFFVPEISFLKSEYFKRQYPEYADINPGYSEENPKTTGYNYAHFFSLHLEHSFQKKFWFARPFVEFGMGVVNFEGFRKVLKKTDENKFLDSQVNLNSGPCFTSTFGLDLGVRFLRNLFSISFTPALGIYNWNWTLVESSIDPVGKQTLNSRNFSSNQFRFLFMANLGCRVPLDLKF